MAFFDLFIAANYDSSMVRLRLAVCMFVIVNALAHYKDFHKDFSEKIVVKIFVHIQNS